MTAPDCDVTDCGTKVYARGWCRKHHARWQRNGDPLTLLVPSEHREYVRVPESDRFWSKVEKTETCWLWTGAKADTGYGTFWVPGRESKRASTHRWAYEALVGPIPEGLVLDHLCRVRECVRPDHLEPVTQGENVRRYTRTITHCPQGHEYNAANTSMRRGHRECRTCHRERERARRERRARAA